MAMFSSARLALRGAASLGAGLCRAAEDPFSRRLLHGQLLPRSFASDAFGHNRPFPPSGSGIADMDPRQNFNSFNFVRQDTRANAQVSFNNTNNGAAMPRTATGEKPFSLREGFPFSSSRAFTNDHEQYSKKKRDFVHVLLKRKKTFVTVTDSNGNKKTGASAGCLEDRKGRSRLSRYASEAVAEHVGRSARKMGLTSVVMKVKGVSFFKKKKKVILGFREGFRGERVRDRSPIMYIHDVTQLPHNGCRLRKQRRDAGPPEVDEDDSMSIDNLHRFFDLNVGKWDGSFYQFDAHGRVLQEISTRLSVSTYGEDNLISLLQSLYIKQASSAISIVDEEDSEPEWMEYKIKETNMFTVDKYQQIGFFPEKMAFALRYQTAGMLETVLRVGVLGEDDTGEESPKNLKIPSRKPSIVCENCLYSLEGNGRMRAFHIMDPKGVLDTLLVFHEIRQGSKVPQSLTNYSVDTKGASSDRINALLGRWEGHSVTKRSGVYGATLAEADTAIVLKMDSNGQLIQDTLSTKIRTGTTTTVNWTGSANENLLQFDGGYEITLLPGGMYMGYPTDISKSVSQLDSFHLEFCWMESPGKRQRLVRTYDSAGLAVSSTYFFETKV